MGRLDDVCVIRLPKGTHKRAEALAKEMGRDAQFKSIGKVTKSMVERIAMMEGLALLEERYLPKVTKKSTR